MMNNVRKLSKNEVLKAMECYDRFPYMPFWWIVREISRNKYGIDRLNYEFKYGYDNPEKGHFHESYSPSKELKDIYRCMQNYIDNKNYNRPHNTSLSMQDYVISSCKQGENSYLNFAEYVNRGNFEQALKERDYWRNARRFIDQHIPKEAENGTWQETNIHYARRFGRAAYKYVGDIIASNNMSSSDPSAIAMHGTISGIIAKMCGNYYIRGEELGKLNKAIVAKIYENKKAIGFSDKDVINFSRRLGEYLGKSLGLGEQLGGEIAEMATRWNQIGEHNVLGLKFRDYDIQDTGLLNFDPTPDSQAGHTAVFMRLRDGRMFVIGVGPQSSSTGKSIFRGNANEEIEVKEIDRSYFDNYTRPMSLHTYNNLTDEHRRKIYDYISGSLYKNTMKSVDGKVQTHTSTDKKYNVWDNSCVNYAYNGMNYAGIDNLSETFSNFPLASRNRLMQDNVNWTSKTFPNKLTQGQISISEELKEKANRKI